MLNENFETHQTENVQNIQSVQSTIVPAETANTHTAVSVTPSMKNPYSHLENALLKNYGAYTFPPELRTPCTIHGSSIKYGENLMFDAGDYVVIDLFDICPYQKLDLGTATVTDEEKKLMVSSYDGNTVMFDEVIYSKQEFLELVKERGFTNASYKNRAVLHGQLVDTDKPTLLDKNGETVLSVYLSPSSLSSFNAFLMKCSMSKDKTAKPIKLSKVGKSYGTKSWTAFAFERYDVEEQQASEGGKEKTKN